MTPDPPDFAAAVVDGGSRWWLNDKGWSACAVRAAEWVEHPQLIPEAQILKRGTRRLVFELELERGQGAVVKAFPLKGLRIRLKHRKYAPSEAANLVEALRRGVPAPALYGWGERRRAGLVMWNAVLMERVRGVSFAAAAASDRAGPSDWRDRSVSLLNAVYRAGCNHIDLKPEAVIFGAAPEDDRLIDFQYCTFGEPSLTTFMAQAGHFAHWWDRELTPSEATVEDWFGVLLDRLEVPAADRSRAREIFDDHRSRVRSIAERLVQ